jgi:hypothetical protein
MGTSFFTCALTGFLKAAVVVAPVGDVTWIKMSSRQRISEAWNANDGAAEVIAKGLTVDIGVKGKTRGISPLVLTDVKGKSQIFLVVVPKPKK